MTLKVSGRLVSTGVNCRRGAFTLIEIILAMSLSVMLLAALYAVLKLHLTFAQKAPEQVRKALHARAIVDRIARDIRAIIPPPSSGDSPAASTTGSSGSAGSTGTTGSSAAGTRSSSGAATASDSVSDPSLYTAAYGVLGGSDWLQLYVADNFASLDDAGLAFASGSVAQVSNVVRVTYSAAVLTTRPDAKGRMQRMALSRSEVASVGAERVDASADDSDFRATTTYLCDDLAQIQFQYWDDISGGWLDSWGVDTPIPPPRAIRILVSLQDPDEHVQVQMGVSGTQSTWDPTFQMVVPVSMWAPEMGSGSTEAGME